MCKTILESKKDVIFCNDPTYIKLFDAPFNEAWEQLNRNKRDSFEDRMATGLGIVFNTKSNQPLLNKPTASAIEGQIAT